MKLAFTIDDLPLWPNSYPPPGFTAGGIIESVVEALEQQGLKGVYAFSNSWALLKHPELAKYMDHWVAAGHHVANHTHNHPELNDISADTYIEEIDLAEIYLAPWMSRAPNRFFRYTLNYWGDTEEKMNRVKAHLDNKGYAVAEATSMLYEWEWNRAYKNAVASANKEGIAYLKASFLDFCVAQLRYDHECTKRWFGGDFLGITLGHFIPFFADIADELFTRLSEEGVDWISLEEAVKDPIYKDVCSVPSKEFLVFQQKLAHAMGLPMSVISPSHQAIYERIEEMAEGQDY